MTCKALAYWPAHPATLLTSIVMRRAVRRRVTAIAFCLVSSSHVGPDYPIETFRQGSIGLRTIFIALSSTFSEGKHGEKNFRLFISNKKIGNFYKVLIAGISYRQAVVQ